jgi:hypothetical protein
MLTDKQREASKDLHLRRKSLDCDVCEEGIDLPAAADVIDSFIAEHKSCSSDKEKEWDKLCEEYENHPEGSEYRLPPEWR